MEYKFYQIFYFFLISIKINLSALLPFKTNVPFFQKKKLISLIFFFVFGIIPPMSFK